MIRAWSNSRSYGGAGADRISATSDSYAEGGEGNDTISADNGSVVAGGTGDDTISANRGSTVMFGAGDGKDTVYAGLDTTIKLGEGLSAKDMTIADRVATLSFGDGSDQIKIHMNFQSPVTLAFAGGTTTEIGAPRIPMVDLWGLQPPGGLVALKV